MSTVIDNLRTRAMIDRVAEHRRRTGDWPRFSAARPIEERRLAERIRRLRSLSRAWKRGESHSYLVSPVWSTELQRHADSMFGDGWEELDDAVLVTIDELNGFLGFHGRWPSDARNRPAMERNLAKRVRSYRAAYRAWRTGQPSPSGFPWTAERNAYAIEQLGDDWHIPASARLAA